MEDLGVRLKRLREERGLALKDLAAKTKLSVAALEALERSDYARLPGGIFGRSFVRAYAAEVGADPDATVAEFVALLEKDERDRAARKAVRPEVTADDRAFLERQRRALRGLQVVLGLVALLAIVLIGWQVRAWWQRSAAKRAAAASATAQAAAPTSATSPTLDAAPAAAPASDSGAASPSSAPAAGVPAASAAPAPSSTAASAPTGPLVLGASDPLVIDLTLTADCWVAATADGKSAGSELLRAGSTRRYQGAREVTLDVGNAGAITWTINGRPAKPLGRDGVHVHARISRDNAASLIK